MYNFEADTDEGFDAGDLTVLDGLDRFSMHARCWMESISTRHHVIGKQDSGANQLRFFFEPDPVNLLENVPKLLITIGNNTARAEGALANSFPLQSWTAFGGTFITNQAIGVKVYIDGVMAGESSTTVFSSGQVLANVAGVLYVGRRSTSGESWDGLLGEVAIWKEVLPAVAFAAMARGVSALCVDPKNMIFYWDGKSPKAWLPQTNEFVTMTPVSTPDLLPEDTYPLFDEDTPEDLVPSPTAAYGAWTEVVVLDESGLHGQARVWRDTLVEAGKTYQYMFRAEDNAVPSNTGPDSAATGDVTPTAGTPGGPITVEEKGWLRVVTRRIRDSFYKWEMYR